MGAEVIHTAHPKIIMVTSFKGGVGKSTITANLSLSVAQTGKTVLCIDCDLNTRCLDLIFGLEDKVVYDVCDVVTGRIPPKKAVVQDERAKELFFLAAPYNLHDTVTPEQFRRAVYEMQECFHADYIFLDTPGDNGLPYSLASAAADAALVISTHQPASIRAAEKTAEQLQKSGITDRRLIINNFDFAAVRKGLLPGISEIIDRTTVPLLGVIPYDMQFGRLQEHGALFDSSPSLPASTAIRNITQRLLCPTVRLPLFTGFGSAERKTVRL